MQTATVGNVIGLTSWLISIAFGRVAEWPRGRVAGMSGISGITASAASALAQARPQPHVLLDWRVRLGQALYSAQQAGDVTVPQSCA